ncbi:MAG: transcription elongation factor [Chitinophagaceae bacterium]|nr:transcription elongation factor [Chitinophagaceae bacterium]
MASPAVKQVLYDLCSSFVDERILMYQKAMKDAQEAANQEEKSSAGDKYETTRAMMQIEKDKNAKQLEETIKLKKALSQINPHTTSETVSLGSLVLTDKGNFYISISAGKIKAENTEYIAIAPTSPLGAAFMNRKARENAVFNGISYTIHQVI